MHNIWLKQFMPLLINLLFDSKETCMINNVVFGLHPEAKRHCKYSKSLRLKESGALCYRFIMGFSIIISQTGQKCIINQAERPLLLKSAVTQPIYYQPSFPISDRASLTGVWVHSCRCAWYNQMCAERPGSHFPPHCSTITARRRGKTRQAEAKSALISGTETGNEAFWPISRITGGISTTASL